MMKMITIGLGKRVQAESIHAHGAWGLRATAIDADLPVEVHGFPLSAHRFRGRMSMPRWRRTGARRHRAGRKPTAHDDIARPHGRAAALVIGDAYRNA